MKYNRLTKEQFEELHLEFINFLATQSITGDEWTQIKEKQPEVAEQELDVFSDLIWEGVLSKAKFLQNNSSQQLFLFKLAETEMQLIMVKVKNPGIDLTTTVGFEWLRAHFNEDTVELFTAAKAYSEERNTNIFDLITQGAEITNGAFYEAFQELI